MKPKRLLRSHILPEFLYRPVYDEKHRTLSLSLRRPTRVIQKGLRERLLCADCEAVMQRYEHYFARVWYRDWTVPPLKDGDRFQLTGLDYTRFKLFALSVAWRASVSGLDDYDDVTLGPHEDRIRQMLLRGEPGCETEYSVVAGLLVDPETGLRWDGVVMAPMRVKVSGHWAIRSVFGGAVWTVFTTSHRTLPFELVSVREDGTLLLSARSCEEYARESGMVDVARKTDAPDLR
jgi:hypothetical protein